ncbi:hypothetical protein QUF76_02055 [Desulfobacterales bacterium HSG16]|nr:hypothetical protein [Desulfobacterales bacterium HSG16]
MSNNENSRANSYERIEEIPSRKMTDEEKYYQEQSYKEPVEGIARIEDTAKFLLGATATTSGLYLGALRLSIGKSTVTGIIWYLPFLWWALSIIGMILVIFPEKYETGKNEPGSWKKAFLKARKLKYIRLFIGTLFFIFGIITAVIPIVK